MIQRNRTAWFAGRAVLALAMIVGFYVLALGLAGLLFWIPYAGWRYLHRVDIRLAVACIVGGLVMLVSVVPRKDHFTPPGPKIEEDDQQALFAMLRDVAAATGQTMPSDVYLLNQVNAFVAERGGRMGFGGVRVMGVGLPLIQALSVDELRAVIAHEFGHYWAGDVRLGPAIHRTHSSIAQAIENLDDSLLAKPFVWYSRLFLRVTMAVSRRQEFVADEVSARVTSPKVAAEALRRVAATGPAFPWYLQHEVVPALNSGVLPPIASGFDAFLNASRVKQAMSRFAEREPSDDGDVYDSHPRLEQRLSALAALGTDQPRDRAAKPATTLLRDPEKLATSLLAFGNGEEVIRRLRRIDWSDVAEAVYATRWRAISRQFAAPLAQFSIDSLPVGDPAAVDAGRRLLRPGEARLNDRDAARQRAIEVLSAALGACLLSRGWTLQGGVGEPLLLVHGAESIEPLAVVIALTAKAEDAERWKMRCATLGLTGCALAPDAGDPMST